MSSSVRSSSANPSSNNYVSQSTGSLPLQQQQQPRVFGRSNMDFLSSFNTNKLNLQSPNSKRTTPKAAGANTAGGITLESKQQGINSINSNSRLIQDFQQLFFNSPTQRMNNTSSKSNILSNKITSQSSILASNLIIMNPSSTKNGQQQQDESTAILSNQRNNNNSNNNNTTQTKLNNFFQTNEQQQQQQSQFEQPKEDKVRGLSQSAVQDKSKNSVNNNNNTPKQITNFNKSNQENQPSQSISPSFNTNSNNNMNIPSNSTRSSSVNIQQFHLAQQSSQSTPSKPNQLFQQPSSTTSKPIHDNNNNPQQSPKNSSSNGIQNVSSFKIATASSPSLPKENTNSYVYHYHQHQLLLNQQQQQQQQVLLTQSGSKKQNQFYRPASSERNWRNATLKTLTTQQLNNQLKVQENLIQLRNSFQGATTSTNTNVNANNKKNQIAMLVKEKKNQRNGNGTSNANTQLSNKQQDSQLSSQPISSAVSSVGQSATKQSSLNAYVTQINRKDDIIAAALQNQRDQINQISAYPMQSNNNNNTTLSQSPSILPPSQLKNNSLIISTTPSAAGGVISSQHNSSGTFLKPQSAKEQQQHRSQNILFISNNNTNISNSISKNKQNIYEDTPDENDTNKDNTTPKVNGLTKNSANYEILSHSFSNNTNNNSINTNNINTISPMSSISPGIHLPNQDNSYYMPGIEQSYKLPLSLDYFSQLQREHFLQTFQGIQYATKAKPANPHDLTAKRVFLKAKQPGKKTLVFDLDETLIHCNESANIPSDVVLSIRFPQGEILDAGINVRPFAVELLKTLSADFEIVVFTASHSSYAKAVLDYLDPHKRYIHHRFFRDHCIITPQGVYIKDLRIFADRSLSEMVLIDNAAYSFAFQIENGIPIIPFYENKQDQELKILLGYLQSLKDVKDVREVNKNTFKFHVYQQADSAQKVYERLFKENKQIQQQQQQIVTNNIKPMNSMNTSSTTNKPTVNGNHQYNNFFAPRNGQSRQPVLAKAALGNGSN